MSSKLPPNKPFKILFVDNSRTTRAVMSSILAEHGYSVTTAGTGQEAIDTLKAEPFDLAIMDLYMPIMNGYEAAKIIRALPDASKDVPIIALTASEDAKDIELCKTAGMNEYVVKADDHKSLLAAIEKYRLATQAYS